MKAREKINLTCFTACLPLSLNRLLLPLGILHSKEEARAAAREKNLFNADQKDSQEICFLPEGETYADYLLKRGVNPKPGNFIDNDGHILGQHQGLVRYTIGQRKGLGITFGKPVFVIRMDPGKQHDYAWR